MDLLIVHVGVFIDVSGISYFVGLGVNNMSSFSGFTKNNKNNLLCLTYLHFFSLLNVHAILWVKFIY